MIYALPFGVMADRFEPSNQDYQKYRYEYTTI